MRTSYDSSNFTHYFMKTQKRKYKSERKIGTKSRKNENGGRGQGANPSPIKASGYRRQRRSSQKSETYRRKQLPSE